MVVRPRAVVEQQPVGACGDDDGTGAEGPIAGGGGARVAGCDQGLRVGRAGGLEQTGQRGDPGQQFPGLGPTGQAGAVVGVVRDVPAGVVHGLGGGHHRIAAGRGQCAGDPAGDEGLRAGQQSRQDSMCRRERVEPALRVRQQTKARSPSVSELIASAGLPRRTPKTLTSPEALLAELEAVRARGFAVDDEENGPTIRCIGAAILGPAGRPIGGVSVTTVTLIVSREEIEAYAPALRAATEALAPLL
ncbi:IclR family transcriptional regulator C-terminal domain-containing protein [Streptomyces sp. NPDC050448]|uniref:IclR family transcriptional regulator domain-containing protein n=1 Tax=Streptomyces sp. NPDC050448 TaxID=3155404 RepID=UPI00343CD080